MNDRSSPSGRFTGGAPAKLAFLGFVVFHAYGGLPAQGRQSESSDDEKRPNIVAPFSQFGSLGAAPGQLLSPGGAAWGKQDRLYVADTGNHRVQVFTPEGKLLYGWGGAGSDPGQFLSPSGIAVGAGDEVYVADTGNDRVQVFAGDGKFLRQWGGAGVMTAPSAIAAGRDRIYLAGGGVPGIESFTPRGERMARLGKPGEDLGELREPQGLAVDEEGNCYVSDAVTHCVQKFDRDGRAVLRWGTWGYPAGFFSTPAGLAVAQGRLYVCDSANHRIQVFDRTGAFLCQWGAPPSTEHGGDGRLHGPWSVSVSPSGGYAVVCEPRENRCQVFPIGTARKITPVKDLPWWDNLHARFHGMMIPVLGPGVPAGTKRWDRNPPVLASILEQDTHSALLFDIALRPCYFLTRTSGFGRRLGEFRAPVAVARDPSTGRHYVADRGNRRVQILELPKDETRRSGFAPAVKVIGAFDPALQLPAGVSGIQRDLVTVDGLVLDASGHLIVADASNAALLVFDRDGGLVRACRVGGELRGPRKWLGLAAAPGGRTVYVLDQYRFVLAVDEDGAVRSSWGRRGSEGDDAFLLPSGIAVDDEGFVYITDAGRDVVKKFDPKGKLVRQWGGHGALDAQFWGPQGITMAGPDRILIDDVGNHRGQIFTRNGEFLVSFYKGGSTLPFPAR
jgi:DNA-binding beta-propeller fold protein YncE